jgi:hypothetical protein
MYHNVNMKFINLIHTWIVLSARAAGAGNRWPLRGSGSLKIHGFWRCWCPSRLSRTQIESNFIQDEYPPDSCTLRSPFGIGPHSPGGCCWWIPVRVGASRLRSWTSPFWLCWKAKGESLLENSDSRHISSPIESQILGIYRIQHRS